MNWSREHTRALIEAADEKPRVSIALVRVIRRHHGENGLVERIARLGRFCERTDALPLVWGQSDCSLLIADWAIENGYDDPAAAWRGAYSTEDGCRALVGERGTLKDVIGACALSVGLKPLHEPEFGAVAVIGSERNPERQWGAIWSGRRWLVKWGDEREAKWTPFVAPVLGMWSVQ